MFANGSKMALCLFDKVSQKEGRSRVVSKRKDMELDGFSTLGVDRTMEPFMIPLECD